MRKWGEMYALPKRTTALLLSQAVVPVLLFLVVSTFVRIARRTNSPGVGPASFGGLGPGLLAIVLSLLAVNWSFITPTHTFSITSIYDVLALAARG